MTTGPLGAARGDRVPQRAVAAERGEEQGLQAAGCPSSRTHTAGEYADAPAGRSSASTTWPSVPSRATAPPERPDADHEAPPARCAVRPLPVASAAVLPEVSSKRCRAANSGGGGGGSPVSQ
nr:hypothetical protein StreXyl84_58310 [Streptomyces sp. Xyl84]